MSLAGNYIDAPTFYSGVEISGGDLNTQRRNAMILQNITLRGVHVFESHRKITNWEGKASGVDIWKGGFMYRVGLTNAHFSIAAVKNSSNPRIKISFNDTVVYDAAMTTGTANINLSINDKGYTDYQIITVRIYLYSNTSSENITPNTVYVSDAYVEPLASVMTTPWVGITNATDTLTQTVLNNLSNSEDWLLERLSLVPYLHNMSLLQFQSQRNQVGTWPIYYAYVTPTTLAKVLKGSMYIYSKTNESYFNITINGYTKEFGPFNYGNAAGRNISIDLVAEAGCVVDNSYQMVISERIVQPKTNDGTRLNSRLSVSNFRLVSDTTISSSGFPPPELPTNTSIVWSSVVNTVNTVNGMISTIKSTIDANQNIFNRARMFRGGYGIKPDQDEYWMNNFVARNIRRGDTLWVKGRGLTIMYGSQTLDINDKEEKWDYKFEWEEELTSGDSVETKRFNLDQFEGLYPGMVYFIRGKELYYASEYLR